MRCERGRWQRYVRVEWLLVGLLIGGLGCAGDRHSWTEALTGVEQPVADATVGAIADMEPAGADATAPCEDGESRPCAAACFTGQETCEAGEWAPCDAPPPSDEVCDGIDNDCDGSVDEGLTDSCCVDGLTPVMPCNGCPAGVAIPAGWVCMPGASDAEALLVSATEVTRGRWSAVLGEALPEGDDGRRPMDGISWFEAAAWCNAASRAEGLVPCYRAGLDALDFDDIDAPEPVRLDPTCDGYRLPTGDEWVRAVRAGHDGPAPGVPAGAMDWMAGDCAPALDPHAWYICTAGERLQPVGGSEARMPNALGVVDGIGNVWEWVQQGDGAAPVEPDVGGPLRGCSAADRAVRCAYDYVRQERNTLRVPHAGLRPVRRPMLPDDD